MDIIAVHGEPSFHSGYYAMTTKEAFKVLRIPVPHCRLDWLRAQRRWKLMLVNARNRNHEEMAVLLSQAKRSIFRSCYCLICGLRIQQGAAHCRLHRLDPRLLGKRLLPK